jgi:hypothetical protein
MDNFVRKKPNPDSMGEVLGVARKLGDTFSTGLDSLGR